MAWPREGSALAMEILDRLLDTYNYFTYLARVDRDLADTYDFTTRHLSGRYPLPIIQGPR
ncbi:hypothetical protein D3C78_1817900 [compost metagenome]